MGIFDGIGDFLGGAVDAVGDVLGGAAKVGAQIAGITQPLAQVGSALAPVFAFGATEDQLQQQYKIWQEAQGFNANESQLQFLRNEMLSSSAHNRSMAAASTQYQRAVQDMQAAGLNPMLAYRNGGAAAPVSSPGSSGMASSPGVPNIPSPGLSAITTALQVRRLNADVQLAEAQAKKATEEANIPRASIPKIQAETENLRVVKEKLEYELRHILPEERNRLISQTLLNNASENWTQQRYLHEFDKIKLTKLEAAELVQKIELLKGDVQYQDAMKAVPFVNVLVRMLGLYVRGAR